MRLKLPGYKREELAPGVTEYTRQPAGKHTKSTFEVDAPWIVYHYGLSHDLWWPPWNSTRWTGRMRIIVECAVCGDKTTLKLPIARWGPVKEHDTYKGYHPERLRYIHEHLHPGKGNAMSWAKPLLNIAAHNKGLDLDLLAARLEADLNAPIDPEN